MSGPFTYKPPTRVENEPSANLPIPIVEVNSLLKICSDKGAELSSRFPHFVIPEFVIGAYPLPDSQVNRVIFPIPHDEIVKLPPGKALFLALGKRYPSKDNKPISVHMDLLLDIKSYEALIDTRPFTNRQKSQIRTGPLSTEGKTYIEDLATMSHVHSAVIIYYDRKLATVQLYIMDLGSKNGTRVLKPGSDELIILVPFSPHLINPFPLNAAVQNLKSSTRIYPGSTAPFTIVNMPDGTLTQYGYYSKYGILR